MNRKRVIIGLLALLVLCLSTCAGVPATTTGSNDSQVVSNSILRIFGSSSWTGTGATSHANARRVYTVCNLASLGGQDAYILIVSATNGANSGVSSTDANYIVAAHSQMDIKVESGEDALIVKGSSDTAKVRVYERIDQ